MHAGADMTVLREIADGAKVHPEARIGPFCTIGADVTIGAGTVLASRVTVTGHTLIGRDNRIQDDCVLGGDPQDLKYRGRATWLVLGDRNRLGPKVTAHVGTEAGGYLTRIGDDNVLDAGAHVAHDCYLDNRTHLGSGVLLAGHIRIEDGAVIEEMSGIHHFATIGRFSRVGARTPVGRDVPPFTFFASGGYYTSFAGVRGLNEPGLDAAGLSPPEKSALRQAAADLFESEHAQRTRLAGILARPDLAECVRELCLFCRRSLDGRYGRYRERFRGKLPPEAKLHLPPGVLAAALAELPEAPP